WRYLLGPLGCPGFAPGGSKRRSHSVQSALRSSVKPARGDRAFVRAILARMRSGAAPPRPSGLPRRGCRCDATRCPDGAMEARASVARASVGLPGDDERVAEGVRWIALIVRSSAEPSFENPARWCFRRFAPAKPRIAAGRQEQLEETTGFAPRQHNDHRF